MPKQLEKKTFERLEGGTNHFLPSFVVGRMNGRWVNTGMTISGGFQGYECMQCEFHSYLDLLRLCYFHISCERCRHEQASFLSMTSKRVLYLVQTNVEWEREGAVLTDHFPPLKKPNSMNNWISPLNAFGENNRQPFSEMLTKGRKAAQLSAG